MLGTGADFILILGACAFIAGGVIVILSSLYTRRDLVGERVDIIAQRSTKPVSKAAGAGLDAQLVRNMALSPFQREVARRLIHLGVPPNRAQIAFIALRLTSAFALGATAFVFGPTLTLLAKSTVSETAAIIGAGALGWYIPQLIIRDLEQKRITEVAAGLPDALDLLVICSEAGLALEDGIERVAAELRLAQPALADELVLTAADLKVLPSSEQALAKLADRVNLPPIRSLVTTLSQTMRYGTPLAQAMRVVAAELRNDALLRFEERANSLPALMTVPMIIFIIPTIFLILGGPAVLRIVDILAR